MSSIVGKSTTSSSVIEKRGFFLRTSSIQKIKCSATYPFRLAGTKINRDAIKELMEAIIIKGRVLSQEALVNLFIAIFKLVGVVYSLWVCYYYGNQVCDKSKKTDESLSFQQRLLERIQKLQNHKDRLETKTLRGLSRTTTITTTTTSTVAKLSIEQKIPASSDNKFNTEIAKLRELSAEIQKQKNDSSISVAATYAGASAVKSHNAKNNDYMLTYIVYGCAALIFLQCILLTAALNTTKLPPGLVFLIASLLLIAVIAFKVFFIANMRKVELRTAAKESESPIKGQNTSRTESAQIRQSRPRLKHVIDLNSKTLSKIKLL